MRKNIGNGSTANNLKINVCLGPIKKHAHSRFTVKCLLGKKYKINDCKGNSGVRNRNRGKLEEYMFI